MNPQSPLSQLASLLIDEWAEFGATLICSTTPPLDTIAVASLLDNPCLLNTLLQRHARSIGAMGSDPRVTTSAWSLRYLWRLLPPLVAATSVLQHKFPIAANEVLVLFDDDGTPRQFYLPHEGFEAISSDTFHRYQPLLDLHLEPLFTAINILTRLPKKILWGNTVRYLEVILDEDQGLAAYAPAVTADRIALLETLTLSDGRKNPLCMPRRLAPAQAGRGTPGITLHPQCCLSYRLPRGEYCGGCPLSSRHREITT